VITLQLDALAAHLNCSDAKFNADGAGVLTEFVSQKASVEASLARTCFFGERTRESAPLNRQQLHHPSIGLTMKRTAFADEVELENMVVVRGLMR
jgi:hypothetical protein